MSIINRSITNKSINNWSTAVEPICTIADMPFSPVSAVHNASTLAATDVELVAAGIKLNCGAAVVADAKANSEGGIVTDGCVLVDDATFAGSRSACSASRAGLGGQGGASGAPLVDGATFLTTNVSGWAVLR